MPSYKSNATTPQVPDASNKGYIYYGQEQHLQLLENTSLVGHPHTLASIRTLSLLTFADVDPVHL